MDYQFLKKPAPDMPQSVQKKNSQNPPNSALQRFAPYTGVFSAGNILQLQSAIGNRAVQRLLSGSGLGTVQGKVIQKMKGYDQKTPDGWKTFFEDQKKELEKHLTPRVKAMLKVQLDEFYDQIQNMDDNWDIYLNESIREGVIEDAYNMYSKMKLLIPRAKDTMDLDKSFTKKKVQAETKINDIDALINKTKLNPMQLSFATKEQADAMSDSKKELETIRNEHTTRLTPLSEASTTFSSLTELPLQEQIGTAKNSIKTFDEAPKSKSTDTLALDIERINTELNEANIKPKIKEIVQEAVDNTAKQLDLNDTKVTSLVNKLYHQGSTKTKVSETVDRMVHDQHNPDKDVWLDAIGLTQTNNLWIKNNVGQIDGIDAHASLYTNHIPNNPSVATALATLQDQILGDNMTGFHVTLEKFGPFGTGGNNPHSYRKGPTIRNDFPFAETGKLPWGQVSPLLEALKNVEVTQVENDIRVFKENLGKR